VLSRHTLFMLSSCLLAFILAGTELGFLRFALWHRICIFQRACVECRFCRVCILALSCVVVHRGWEGVEMEMEMGMV
jgi:hypothetical protein